MRIDIGLVLQQQLRFEPAVVGWLGQKMNEGREFVVYPS
jgi:hypothetical protein